MIQRYLGNKSSIADSLLSVIREVAQPGDLVFDAFSGSLAVTSALRQDGFRVACNDINHFSWLYTKAFCTSTEMPAPSHLGGAPQVAWRRAIEELTAPVGDDLPSTAWRTDIFDHYCEEGGRSSFVSRRGSAGRRRFFSAANAQAIDRALSRIRHHSRAGTFDERTRCILTACLLTGVEKISNTQGTYHDFPRDFYDSRALLALSIPIPGEDVFRGTAVEQFGRCEDSIEFAKRVDRHSVLYLDPPYNFRQYTAYYFMLNLLSSYAEIDDLDSYFEGIEHVRGQNMSTDFKSTFCSKSGFIPSLSALIKNSQSDYVVMSYFDGRNHWGSFKSQEADLDGRAHLEALLSSPLFVSGSLKCFPVLRKNYQSYGGYQAKAIQEFIFVARRAWPAVGGIADGLDSVGVGGAARSLA